MATRSAPIGALLALLGGLAWLALGAPRSAAEPEAPPNVLLISVDTLRADHLGCYGYARATSPVLDALAARSLRFADAHAPTPWTLPSHAALLTGRHPLDLGILDKSGRVPEGTATVAELLRARGYQTAAFVDSGAGGNVGATRGFGRGFDRFAHAPHGGGGGRFRYDTARTVEAGLAWLAARDRARPFFLFLHTKSVHAAPVDDPLAGFAPYTKPETYVERFLPGGKPRFRWSERELRGQRYLFDVNRRLAAGQLEKTAFPPEQLEELVALYDAGVYYADEQIGRLLEALASRGLERDTVVLVTSDHGEAFLENQFFLHQELYHALIHVPLILHDPRRATPGTVLRTVYLEDVAATIVELAGASAPKEMAGRSLLAGGGAPAAPRVTYFRFGKGAGYEAYGLEDGPWLLLHHKTDREAAFRTELLALHSGVATSATDRAARESAMKERLLARVGTLLERPPPEEPVDVERLKELRALGYVE